MAFTSGASRTRTRRPSEGLSVPSYRAEEWDEPEKPRRDWTKIVLIIGLASLSWVATYVGMLELIQSNMGSLPITHKVIIGFLVAMLMTMIVWLLDQLFAPLDWFTKGAFVGGYLVLDDHLHRFWLRLLLNPHCPDKSVRERPNLPIQILSSAS